jgi:hypothetical protein
MKALLRPIVWLAVAAFPACYESPVPLDAAPQADIDPGVVGAWRCLPPEPGPTDEPANLTVTPSRDRVYEAVFTADGEDPDRYEAHASLVKGTRVVNVRDLSATNGKPWAFATYALLRPDVLEIRIADDDAFKGVEPMPAALRKRFESLAGDARLFSGYCVCVRQKKSGPASSTGG